MSDIDWINDNGTNSQVLSHPDIKGWVAIKNDGSQHVASDKTAETLGDILIYFNEITSLVGSAFALGNPDEIHIVCEELTAVCLPGKKETVGVIFDPDTRPNEFLAKFSPL